MASVPDLVQICHDITAIKMVSIGTVALWTYEYLLTVGDEAKYAWKTESVLMLGLFLFVRYIPALFLVWATITMWYPSYTAEICGKTAWIGTLHYASVTACAQMIMGLRTYAITKKNKWIAGILFLVGVTEFCIGIAVAIRSALHPGDMPVIPLQSYQICFANVPRAWTLAQISFLFVFDIAVFALVLVKLHYTKTAHRGVQAQSILDVISRDGGVYFGFIASSHFLVVVMYMAARPGLRAVGIVLNAVLIPMMISRIVISLKKFASERQGHLSVDVPSPMSVQEGYNSRLVEGIPLSVLKGEGI